MSPKPSFTGILAPSTSLRSARRHPNELDRLIKGVLTRLFGWLAHDTSHVSVHPTRTACVDSETLVLTRKYGGDCIDACFANTIALTFVAEA